MRRESSDDRMRRKLADDRRARELRDLAALGRVKALVQEWRAELDFVEIEAEQASRNGKLALADVFRSAAQILRRRAEPLEQALKGSG